MTSKGNVHVVIFPFMSQGHTNPIIDFSKVLAHRKIEVTIITTPKNSPSIASRASRFSNINIKEIPFPYIEGLPEGCENTSHITSPSIQSLCIFISGTKLLQDSFEQSLFEMYNNQKTPTCVISDSFLGWTKLSCQKFGIPRLVFNGMGVFAMLVKKYLVITEIDISKELDDNPIVIKDLQLDFAITKADLPRSAKVKDGFSQHVAESEKSDIGSWGVIANSFWELESKYVPPLESIYGLGSTTWCVGPFSLYNQMDGSDIGPNPSTTWAKWLDQQSEEKSVLYISFGSQAKLSKSQLDELAYGLAMSGCSFFWVIRLIVWDPPSDVNLEKGLVVKDWVDQKWVLAHRTIGGFLSHCGWNSTLEGLSSGVPILAWPIAHEQPLNARLLVDGLKVALRVPTWDENSEIVGRKVICQGVKQLMKEESGNNVRERASELGFLAKKAVQKGGSSHKCLEELISRLSDLRTSHVNC